jgi:hypothetical protein
MVKKKVQKDNSKVLMQNALEKLSREQSYFKSFKNIWEWIYSENEEKVDNYLKYLEYVKNVVIRKYWSQDLFISPTALDAIIFYCIQQQPKESILIEIDKLVTDYGLTNDSVVIFPLTNFGFKYGGLGKFFRTQSISYSYENFEVYSQTNSFDNTKNNVRAYLDKIKIKYRSKLDYSLFEHYFKSRNLKWFQNNPLLIMHFKFSQTERYDNIRFVIEKINFVTTKLYFLSILANTEDRVGSLLSTSNTNNFETNDIYHFLTITTLKKSCTLNCVPIHFSQFEIYELMNMNIDLLIKAKAITHWEKNAIGAIEKLYTGFMAYMVNKKNEDLKFFRIANSLNYFRRSLKSRKIEDKIININIAYECLLLDEKKLPKRQTILDRVWLALKKNITKKVNIKNISDVIDERNKIVHAGLPVAGKCELGDVYKTYCRLILFYHNQIKNIDSTDTEYISNFFDNYRKGLFLNS